MDNSAPAFRSLDEFWPFYVAQHLNPTNRALHFVGTTAGVALALGALVTLSAPMLGAALIAGYGPAWLGHFVFERNRPATLGWARLSFSADLRMWRLTLAGRMGAEIARLGPELRRYRAG